MAIGFGISMLAALFAGGAVGSLITAGHFHRVAWQEREYEREAAETAEIEAARAMIRRMGSYES